MARSKRLEIIFHNGEPEGIRIYMRHLSTIKAFVIPRLYLAEAKKLTGVDNPGVYFLINDETGSLSKIYIGQTRNGISRLDDHNSKKDFWNKAILFLADSQHFTLNIISGLEKYAIQKAIDANRYQVDNKAVPKYQISEYDLPQVEEIYEEIEFIMGTLGFRMNDSSTQANQQVFTTSRRGVVGTDVFGNITRFDNALEGLQKRLEFNEQELRKPYIAIMPYIAPIPKKQLLLFTEPDIIKVEPYTF